jgi:hypothetical protein
VPLVSFKGGFLNNVGRLLTNMGLYNKVYVIGGEGIYFGHSLFGLLKFIMLIKNKIQLTVLIFMPYLVVALTGFILISLYIIFIEKEFWKKVALLVFAMNLLPFVSGDYKLLHIFIPLFLFINNGVKTKLDYVYTILFGLLLIPKDYYHYPPIPEVTISVMLNPLIMLAITFLIIMQGTKDGVRLWSEPVKT